MFNSKEEAFEAMVGMANEIDSIGVLGEDNPNIILEEGVSYKVEHLVDRYRVEVEADGIRCVAEKTGDTVVMISGTEAEFCENCEEFCLAW